MPLRLAFRQAGLQPIDVLLEANLAFTDCHIGSRINWTPSRLASFTARHEIAITGNKNDCLDLMFERKRCDIEPNPHINPLLLEWQPDMMILDAGPQLPGVRQRLLLLFPVQPMMPASRVERSSSSNHCLVAITFRMHPQAEMEPIAVADHFPRRRATLRLAAAGYRTTLRAAVRDRFFRMRPDDSPKDDERRHRREPHRNRKCDRHACASDCHCRR